MRTNIKKRFTTENTEITERKRIGEPGNRRIRERVSFLTVSLFHRFSLSVLLPSVCSVISVVMLLIFAAGLALGAETGSISGAVVDARTGEPVVGAAVRVEGLSLGAAADTSGRFVLTGVPAGRHRLRVERIGYGRLFREVDVAGGQEVRVRLAASQEAVPAGEVTVTGERERARDVEQAPTFATVIEAPAFQGRTTSLPEVLAEVAGVQVQSLGGLGSFSTISIRGSSAEQVQVYLDGVLLNTALGGGVNLSDIPASEVERVEVYRGRAPLWSGGEGMGGVVHIRTWRTGARSEQRGSVSWGSFRTGQGSWTVSHRRGRVGVLASADYSRSANDFRFLDDNGTEYNPDDDEPAHRVNNDFGSAQVLTKLSYEGGQRLSVTLSNSFYRKGQGLPNISNNQSRHARFETLRDFVEGAAEVRGLAGGRLTLRQTFSFSHVAEVFRDRFGEVGVGSQDNHNVTRTLVFRQAGRMLIGRRHVVSTFYEVRGEGFRPSDRLAPDSRFFRSRRWTLAGGGEDEGFLLGERLRLVSSVRAEATRSRFFDENPFLASAMAPRQARSDLTWSIQEGIHATLLPGLVFKGNVGRYGRLPSFYELFGDRGGIVGNTDLRPEQGVTWDAGLRAEWRGEGPEVSGEVVYYDRRAEDLIQFVQHSQGVSRPANIGQARVRGAEVTLQGRPGKVLTLSGNYTYQLALDRSNVPHRRNKVLPNRPKHEGQGTGEVRVGPVRLTYNLAFEGGSFLDRANLRPVRARVIHNAGAGLTLFRTVRLMWEVKNLTDDQVADVWGYPLPGRGYFLGASGQF